MSTATGRPRPFLDGVFRTACNYCVRSKRGCSGGTPCEQCEKRGKTCTYAQRRMSGPRGRPSGHSHRVRSRARARRQRRAEALRMAIAGASPTAENNENLIRQPEQGSDPESHAGGLSAAGVGGDVGNSATFPGQFSSSGAGTRAIDCERGAAHSERRHRHFASGVHSTGMRELEAYFSSDSEYMPSDGSSSDLDTPLASSVEPQRVMEGFHRNGTRQGGAAAAAAAGRSTTAAVMQQFTRRSSRRVSSSSSIVTSSSSTPGQFASAPINNYDSDSGLVEAATISETNRQAAVQPRNGRPGRSSLSIQAPSGVPELMPFARTVSQSPRLSSLPSQPTPTITPPASAPAGSASFRPMSVGACSPQSIIVPSPDPRLLHSARLPVPTTTAATAVANYGGTVTGVRYVEAVPVSTSASTSAIQVSGVGFRDTDSVFDPEQRGNRHTGFWIDRSDRAQTQPASISAPTAGGVVGDKQEKQREHAEAVSSTACAKSPLHSMAATPSAVPPPSLIPYDDFESGAQRPGGLVAALIDCESVSSTDDDGTGSTAGGEAKVESGVKPTIKRKLDEIDLDEVMKNGSQPYQLFKRQHAWVGNANGDNRTSSVQMAQAFPGWNQASSPPPTVGSGDTAAMITNSNQPTVKGYKGNNPFSYTQNTTTTTHTTTVDVVSAFPIWKGENACGATMIQSFPSASAPAAGALPRSAYSIPTPVKTPTPLPAAALPVSTAVPSDDYFTSAPAHVTDPQVRASGSKLKRSMSTTSLSGTVSAGTDLWEEFVDLECATMASMASPLTREASLMRAMEAVGAEMALSPSPCEAAAFADLW